MAIPAVVLISGTGSNLADLLSRLDDSLDPPIEVVAVGADVDAPGLDHATTRAIPTFVHPLDGGESREAWGRGLAQRIADFDPELIILSGFMKLLPAGFVDRFSPRIINTHPAFLPEFPGAHAVADQLAAGVAMAGASVITVDNGVDTGPILARSRVTVLPGDTEDTLHERIKTVERELLWQVLIEQLWARHESFTEEQQ